MTLLRGLTGRASRMAFEVGRAAVVVCLVLLMWGHAAAMAQTADEPDFRDLFGSHSAAMLLIDPASGAIVDANAAAASFYGYAADRLRTMVIQDINVFTPEQVAEERASAARDNRNFFIFRHRLASGEVRTVEVYSSPAALAGRTLLWSVIIDISQLRTIQQDLWHYQKQLEEMVDLQTAEIRDRSLLIILVLAVAATVLGVVVALLAADVRRRRWAEREARHLAERLEATQGELQRFAEIAAHHLQEPSRRVVSYVALLERRLGAVAEREEVAPVLAVIQEQAERQRALVRDVQVYLAAGQDTGGGRRAEPDAVVAKVRQAVAPLYTAAGATLEIGALPPVPLDERRLGDILRLVLENAVHHRDPARPLHVTVSGARQGDCVVYRIADNGPGIPEPYRERVFGVFEHLGGRRDPGRTGVGLAIVRHVMESVGGRVWADQGPEGGALIVLEFPEEEARDG